MSFYVLRAEFKKLTMIMWILVFLGPIGVFTLTAFNYYVRYDWLRTQTDDYWLQLLRQLNLFIIPALVLGTALLASIVASIEHKTNAWRKLLTLPVPRVNIYCSKFIVLSLLLLLSTLLTFIGTLLFGSFFDWEQPVPYGAIAINSFYPFFAVLPLLALHLWFSVAKSDQGLPLTVGIIGAIVSMYSYGGPEWFIWKWAHLENKWEIPEISVFLGIIVGCTILLLSLLHFERKDVK
ncbi:ABC transporter permease [Evansella sp. AB-rgal1]|uniref:ABC transporter permease n=1 Tax=Evansella sp. AB-rgal1 TaxID=3242696 RepID=UPI00359CC6CE